MTEIVLNRLRNRIRASVISTLLVLVGNAAIGKAVADDGDHPATRVASELNRALASGDAEGVRSLMAEDVQIFESGNVEASLEEYSGHHLPADMAFMGAMDSEVVSRRVFDGGDMATVLTLYRLRGSYRDQDIDAVTTETLVLRKTDSAWKIIHVHWSSG